MADFRQLYSMDNEVFKSFVFYAVVLVLKMYVLTFITVKRRYSKKIFTSPEDAAGFKAKVGTDPEIERVRRAHQNDLENIVPFWILGLLFVAIDPYAFVAIWTFRIFTAARFLHSIAYVLVIPQPTRVVAFLLAAGINLFMALEIAANCFF